GGRGARAARARRDDVRSRARRAARVAGDVPPPRPRGDFRGGPRPAGVGGGPRRGPPRIVREAAAGRGRARPGAAGRAAGPGRGPVGDGLVRSWLVAGPFPGASLDVPLGPESNPRPEAAAVVAPLAWKEATCVDGYVDFRLLLNAGDSSVSYAHAWLQTPEAG